MIKIIIFLANLSHHVIKRTFRRAPFFLKTLEDEER